MHLLSKRNENYPNLCIFINPHSVYFEETLYITHIKQWKRGTLGKVVVVRSAEQLGKVKAQFNEKAQGYRPKSHIFLSLAVLFLIARYISGCSSKLHAFLTSSLNI